MSRTDFFTSHSAWSCGVGARYWAWNMNTGTDTFNFLTSSFPNSDTARYTAEGSVLYEPSAYAAQELQSILRVDPITDAVAASQAEVARSVRTAQRIAERLEQLPGVSQRDQKLVAGSIASVTVPANSRRQSSLSNRQYGQTDGLIKPIVTVPVPERLALTRRDRS